MGGLPEEALCAAWSSSPPSLSSNLLLHVPDRLQDPDKHLIRVLTSGEGEWEAELLDVLVTTGAESWAYTREYEDTLVFYDEKSEDEWTRVGLWLGPEDQTGELLWHVSDHGSRTDMDAEFHSEEESLLPPGSCHPMIIDWPDDEHVSLSLTEIVGNTWIIQIDLVPAE